MPLLYLANLKISLLVCLMAEELTRADILLRIVSKAVDFLLVAAAWELLPKAGFFAGVFYVLVSDGFLDGRSIGKKIIGLQVISLVSQKPCSMKDSIIRNLPFAVGIFVLKVPLVGWIISGSICILEMIIMIGSSDRMRIGDMLANTVVVTRDEKSEKKQPNKLAPLEGRS